MKRLKLRGYVLPALYVVILMLVFGTVTLVANIMKTSTNQVYSTSVLNKVDDEVPSTTVVEIQGGITEGIIKPYSSDVVEIDKYYYDINADQDRQANSLIYFSNTYMKNTGLLYTSKEEFDVVAVLDGTVITVSKDEILGNYIELEHSNHIRTIYYILDEIPFKKGDYVSQGEVLGKASTSQITTGNHNLLFEVYYDGALMNPLDFYELDISKIN